MSRMVVVYLFLATGVLFLLSISRPPTSVKPNRHRRLATNHFVNFDPIINKLERRVEEKDLLNSKAFHERLDEILKKQDWGNFDGEIKLFDERLNVTERLMYLFPLLDTQPIDAMISFLELEDWMHKQASKQLIFETERGMRQHDTDGDGEVTLQEYLKYNSSEEIDWSNMQQHEFGWWREKFTMADMDGDGSLNVTEFNDFLHPEDSKNLKIQLWLLKEKLRDMDTDNDGKLNFEEFHKEANKIHGIYESPETGEYRHTLQVRSNAEQKFLELDTDKDNFLTAEELKPIIQHLYPGGEIAFASTQAKLLINEADDDKDGKLTLNEMLNHQQAFYSTVYDEEYTEEEDYFDYHTELRR